MNLARRVVSLFLLFFSPLPAGCGGGSGGDSPSPTLTETTASPGPGKGVNVRVSDFPAGTAFADTYTPGLRGTVVSGSTLFTAWADNRTGRFEIWFSKSEDAGATWSPNVKVSLGINTRENRGAAIVLSNGVLYVGWAGTITPGDTHIYLARSLDGGATFTNAAQVDDLQVGMADLFGPSMAARGDVLYIAWRDSRRGVEDMYLDRSPDAGGTFGTDLRVNDNSAGTVAPENSAVSVLQDGTIYLLWLDSRNAPDTNQYNVFLRAGRDSGILLFSEPSRKINSGKTDEECVPGALAVDSAGNIYAAWGKSDVSKGEATDIFFRKLLRQPDGTLIDGPEVRVNDDGRPEVDQAFPSLAVDGSGTVYIAWKDMRNATSTAQTPDIYFSKSSDGETFTPNVKVNDALLGTNAPRLAADPAGNVYITWSDSRNRISQTQLADVYFAAL